MNRKRSRKIAGVASLMAVAVAMSELSQKAHSQVVTYTPLDLIVTRQNLLTPYGLNNNDQVVGDTYSNSNDLLPFIYTPSATGATRQAQLSGGTFSTVPGITASSNSIATGISNSGVVAGVDGNTSKGFFYLPGASGATEVSALAAGGSLGFTGVNSNGVAVGTSTASGVSTAVTYNNTTGVTTDVGAGFTASLNNSYGVAINDSGTVLAIGAPPASTNSYAAHFEPFTVKAAAGGGLTYTNVGNAVEAAIPQPGSTPGYGLTNPGVGIDSQGNVAGIVGAASTTTYRPFLSNLAGFLYNSSSGTASNVGSYVEVEALANVNGSPELGGTSYVYNPQTFGHQFDAFTQLNGNFVDISGAVRGYKLNDVIAINSNGDLIASGYNISTGSAFTRYLLLVANPVPSVIYTGAASNVWNTTAANFTPTNYADGNFVTFDDTATGSTTISIPSVVSPGGVTFNNSSKSYVINGSAIAGGATTGLTIKGTGTVTLNNSNTFTGDTSVTAGTLVLGSTGSLASNNITLGRNGKMVVESGGALTSSGIALNLGFMSSLTFAPTTRGHLATQLSSLTLSHAVLDLGNSDLIVHNGDVSAMTGYATFQYSSGITSSSAAADSTHLTAVGVIQNSDDGTPTGNALYTKFDGASVSNTDVLVKYTYFGDANLDGKVDGSDYSRIDNAFINEVYDESAGIGWYNGDFNYDGTVNGSDYTLIDNAFNTQGSAFGGSVSPGAVVTTEIAAVPTTSAVPEPTTLLLSSVIVLGVLGRRLR